MKTEAAAADDTARAVRSFLLTTHEHSDTTPTCACESSDTTMLGFCIPGEPVRVVEPVPQCAAQVRREEEGEDAARQQCDVGLLLTQCQGQAQGRAATAWVRAPSERRPAAARVGDTRPCAVEVRASCKARASGDFEGVDWDSERMRRTLTLCGVTLSPSRKLSSPVHAMAKHSAHTEPRAVQSEHEEDDDDAAAGLDDRQTKRSVSQRETSASASSSAASFARPMAKNAAGNHRSEQFRAMLQSDVVDLDKLRELSWGGVPVHHRPAAWRLLLVRACVGDIGSVRWTHGRARLV